MEWLGVRENGCYVDCTAGGGGHAECIAAKLRTGRLVAIDRDPIAVAAARARLSPYPQAEVVHGNYAELRALLRERRIAEVDGVLIDAGVSSMQLDTAERGFSFQEDGPLDMRMDTNAQTTAVALLAAQSKDSLAQLLRRYGDVKFPGRIARAILERRAEGALDSTLQLAAAIREAVPRKTLANDEIRRVFQALRIAVNDELECLKHGVLAAIEVLTTGGRLVVISFHSGEDRIVKQVFRENARPRRILHRDGRVKETLEPVLGILTKKPVVPEASEVRENPRAHSARLRAAERLG